MNDGSNTSSEEESKHHNDTQSHFQNSHSKILGNSLLSTPEQSIGNILADKAKKLDFSLN